MRTWRDMPGDELEVGYWVTVPYRWGERGTSPLAGGWYEIKSLREDEEGDWVIGLGNDRYQWLLKYDTISACETNPLALERYVYERYEPASDLRPGYQVYIEKVIKGWFDVTDYPALSNQAQTSQLLVAIVLRDVLTVGLGGLILAREKPASDHD